MFRLNFFGSAKFSSINSLILVLVHLFRNLLWEFYIPWLNLRDLFPIFFYYFHRHFNLLSISSVFWESFANSFYFTNWFPAILSFYWLLPSLLNLAVVFFKFKQSFLTSGFHNYLFNLHKYNLSWILMRRQTKYFSKQFTENGSSLSWIPPIFPWFKNIFVGNDISLFTHHSEGAICFPVLAYN